MAEWGFLTNHMHVLYCVAQRPGIRIVEIADCVGVRERAAHRLVTELVEGGYLTRRRVGSRNFYQLHPTLPLRREGLDEVAVGEILEVLLAPTAGTGIETAPGPLDGEGAHADAERLPSRE
ncbi:MAG TPA: helix-turn-helix domain-containing protein [Segeticoccus sp.]|nr:helix-turn-helix domain-containing protein [Segeticoccus sp.]